MRRPGARAQVLLAVWLLAAQAFFLWMFLSTEPLERMAEAGRVRGGLPGEVRASAYRYAAEWRHGLAGGWPLYVPGFFAAAVVTWFWSFWRSLRRLIPECAGILCLALVAGLLAAPLGAELVARGFERETGLGCARPLPGPSAQGAMVGLCTLVAWTVVVLSCHRALWWRSYRPLLAPVLADLALVFARPFTFDDLVAVWVQRALGGQPLAIVSLLLVPTVAVFLVQAHLASERREST